MSIAAMRGVYAHGAVRAGVVLLIALAAGPVNAQPATDAKAGRLVIIGGGLSRDTEAVYRAVLDGRHGDGPLCIIPTAGGDPGGSMASSIAAFERHGGAGVAAGVDITVENAGAASDPATVERLRSCAGFYFTGGVQSRISAVFRPEGRSTPAYEALMRRHREGAVVAGSSAGAAIMSDPMISGGSTTRGLVRGIRRTTDPEGDADDGAVIISAGLGFIPAIVDQHVLARGRIGRLIAAVLELNEFDVGFGIDENTALVVEGSTVSPVGASGVVVVDARAAAREGRNAADLRLHLLGAGDRYDLATGSVVPAADRQPLASAAAAAQPADVFARWSFLHLLHGFASSPDDELALDFEGGRLVLRKSADFRAASAASPGVEGTPAGLSITGLRLDVRR
jgi:cyanophycinase